jgi:PDZ domain-containing secreted protein
MRNSLIQNGTRVESNVLPSRAVLDSARGQLKGTLSSVRRATIELAKVADQLNFDVLGTHHLCGTDEQSLTDLKEFLEVLQAQCPGQELTITVTVHEEDEDYADGEHQERV